MSVNKTKQLVERFSKPKEPRPFRRILAMFATVNLAFSGCVGETPEDPRVLELRSQGVMIDIRSESGRRTVDVKAMGPSVTDETLAQIADLGDVRHLVIEGASVTDSGLVALKPITSLEGLNLADTSVTDEGMRFLSEISKLSRLSLHNLPISGTGLQHLGALEQLKSLDLTGTSVNDDDLRALGNLPRLSMLLLERTQVAGSGLTHLSQQATLESILLSGPQVADETLTGIAELSNLASLTLKDCPNVTDSWLETIPKSTSLVGISLLRTPITGEAAERVTNRISHLTVRTSEGQTAASDR